MLRLKSCCHPPGCTCASHQVALRQRLGLPVTPDLVAARELAAPRQPRRVVAERERPQPDAQVNKPDGACRIVHYAYVR